MYSANARLFLTQDSMCKHYSHVNHWSLRLPYVVLSVGNELASGVDTGSFLSRPGIGALAPGGDVEEMICNEISLMRAVFF